MKTCSKCGYTTENDQAKFCKKCGTQFVVTNSVYSDTNKESEENTSDVIIEKQIDIISDEISSEIEKRNVELETTSNVDSISESEYLNFINAIKICYKRSFDYESRASRSEFWWFWLYGVVILVLTIVASENKIDFLSVLFGVLAVGNIIPGIAVRVRRLRNVGTSGWWILGWPIGIIRIWIFFKFMGESDYGENEFGPAPRYTR